MSRTRVRLEIADGVAALTLTRPEKHNALDSRTFEELAAAADQAHEHRDVRALVISGEGPSFCSGLDFGAVRASGTAGRARLVGREPGQAANLVQRCALVWQELPIPVIAALHGHVLGGGLQIALGADIRIAAPDTRLAILELVHGLVPDMGISLTLPPLVGLDVAKELAWTGRVIEADEAQRIGLVTRVAEQPREEAFELARAIAERSPDAVREAKALLNHAWARRGDGQLLHDETAAQQRLHATSPGHAASAPRTTG
jgi:enoyl-CoA hydratase/carnithine racemase